MSLNFFSRTCLTNTTTLPICGCPREGSVGCSFLLIFFDRGGRVVCDLTTAHARSPSHSLRALLHQLVEDLQPPLQGRWRGLLPATPQRCISQAISLQEKLQSFERQASTGAQAAVCCLLCECDHTLRRPRRHAGRRAVSETCNAHSVDFSCTAHSVGRSCKAHLVG